MFNPPPGAGAMVWPAPKGTGTPPPMGVICTAPSVRVSLSVPAEPAVPRIPAVPKGDSISKFEFLSNFLMLKIKSPFSTSTVVSDGLGSDLSSESFLSPGVKGSWANFFKLMEEFSRTVRMVPLDISKMAFEPFPALMVCPSNKTPPVITLSEDNGVWVALFRTSTSPTMLAIMIAPLESIPNKHTELRSCKTARMKNRLN